MSQKSVVSQHTAHSLRVNSSCPVPLSPLDGKIVVVQSETSLSSWKHTKFALIGSTENPLLKLKKFCVKAVAHFSTSLKNSVTQWLQTWKVSNSTELKTDQDRRTKLKGEK